MAWARRLVRTLPSGRPLPERDWNGRHRAIRTGPFDDWLTTTAKPAFAAA